MSRRSKQIVIWGAWYGSRNVGDQALLLTITDILSREIADLRFTVFTNHPEHVNAYTRLESNCKIRAIHNRRQFPKVVSALAMSDLFLFGGGVPFYEEREHVMAMGVLVGLAKLFRTPYMTWTVSSQIVNDPTAKRIFGWVLNGANAITYRDEHTHQLFQSCGVQKPMCLTGDPGFWLEPADPQAAADIIARSGLREEARPLVALTPRTLRGRDGDAQKHYNVKTQSEYELEIACFSAALDWLWEHGYQPILAPMNTVAPDDDRIAASLIIQQARNGGHALSVDEEVRPRMAPALYAHCHASFVARVHGAITSMVANCPVMMYAFAPKHAGIMSSMGLSDYSLLESQATPGAAVDTVTRLLANRISLQETMRERLTILRQEALIPANLAAEILNRVGKN
jgi:polysaccharide pyruvyl transferase WcaK-like protein